MRTARAPLASALLAAAVLVGCGGSSPTATPPAATARPTPTPVTARVGTANDAAALVIAMNPLFAGAEPEDPSRIGASKWWTSVPMAGGGFQIEITVGWGDCMAGCIERHTWTYEVEPDGTTELVAEAGPEVPADLPG